MKQLFVAISIFVVGALVPMPTFAAPQGTIPEPPPAATTTPVDNTRPTVDIRSELQSLHTISARNPQALIGQAIQYLLVVSGSIALIMIIIGGLTIMFATGKADRVKQGSKIIVWASIGLISMILSYLLVAFVIGAII